VQAYWGTVQKASVANDVATASKLGLAVGEYYLLLQPGESILGHTREFIGGRNHITCMVKARSSLGRTNVTVCRDAGMADIGYINRFTLEITNNGTSPLILPVGRRIGQIVFFYTGTPDTTYAGKYQQGATLEEVVTAWQPSMMLPKAYLDK
jgi:dCTP deaminase